MIILFWLAAGLLVFHYFGYPLLMGLLSHLKKNKPFSESGELPPLTMIISVYNEEDVIRERLENCLTLDYPRDKLRILVVSDGSTDSTHSIVEQYSQHGIELVVVPGRVGKTGTLNQVIPELASEIIVFTDANSMLRPDALKNLVRHFADPKVGAVCGELQLTGDAGAEGAYWRYEKAIKEFESKVSTLTVANGALYALRRSLHRPMNPQAANDFQHPLQVALQGYKSIYEPQAVAVETASGDERVEARRRVRIISRGWKGLISNIQVLNPFRAGFFTFQFIARKLLRWLGPFFLAIALGANIALVNRSAFYRATLVVQGVFYGLALLGWLLNKHRIRFKPAYVPFYFCLINWAALKALFRFLMGGDSAVWTPTTNLDASRGGVSPPNPACKAGVSPPNPACKAGISPPDSQEM